MLTCRGGVGVLSVLTRAAVCGVVASCPAGILLDRMGPVATCLAGLVAVVGGYVAMSFTENHVLLLLEYAVAALGSGTTFLSALSTAIGMGYPIGVALVRVHARCLYAESHWVAVLRLVPVRCPL